MDIIPVDKDQNGREPSAPVGLQPFERWMQDIFEPRRMMMMPSLLQEMNDMMRGGVERRGGPLESARAWQPTCDIEEQEDRFVVRAELPGVKKDDVHISLSGDMLSLEGERREEKVESKGNMQRRERMFGHFERRFRLPESVDREKVEAKYEDGVLAIELMKSDKAKREKRTVKIR